MSVTFVGTAVQRKEDDSILRGEARYISDLSVPGMLTASVVRSPFAHAEIRSIDVSAALALEGVEAVYTADDIGDSQQHLASFGQFPPGLLDKYRPDLRPAPITTLAKCKVRYVGEPVALVVAADRYVAEDAAELVEVEYLPLPAVVDMEEALSADAPDLHATEDSLSIIAREPWKSWSSSAAQWNDDGTLNYVWGKNTALDMRVTHGDVDAAFSSAAHVIGDRFCSHRHTGVPLEGRGILALPDIGGQGMLVWSSHQIPYFHRALIAETLGVNEETIRVAQPHLGGGFGQKAGIYSEDVMIPYAARDLGRPVKWLEDKREHFQASSHSREQIFDAELALDAEGHILGLRFEAMISVGAYHTFPVVLPYLGMCHAVGPYRIPTFSGRARSILTNKVPAAPYRGAGRPEVVFMLNRLMDRAALDLYLDPAEIRRRNFIQPEEMPYDAGILYRDGAPLVFDSGDYPGALQKNLEAIGYETFRGEQERARAKRRYLGVGMACNVEAGGIGPVEGARVAFNRDGTATIHLGIVDTGQGHRTAFAQIAADELGLDVAQVRVVVGDTQGITYSRGTYHSRGAVTAGNAVHSASRKVALKLRQLAAALLWDQVQGGVDEDDLEVADGVVRSKTAPELSVPIQRCVGLLVPDGSSVASAVATGGAILSLPDEIEHGLDETSFFKAKAVVWGNASHAAIVEVDPELGSFDILRYVVVHDCGNVLNPLILEGQVHGGVAQGIGGAKLEELSYDEDGQLVSSNLADYMLPRRHDIPHIELETMESPSPFNALGVKGAGEGGTIGPPSVLAAAVEDALSPLGVRITQTPLTPKTILKAIKDASHGGAS
ncbi:MAG: xanthine dehydrogenase family protein molybdopterin-binding subunit [Paracoccaceae bacterium]|nr:xanthine dehydrogenase family protein molybdopterin-binding subunit [Paracoccaceae bacterium]